MAFIAGPFTWTYNAVSIGQLFDGYRLHHTTYGEIITGDNHARRPQDIVYLGEEVTGDGVLDEWDTETGTLGLEAMIWPWGSTWLTGGQVGRIAVQQSIVKSFVGTAVAGPPAATEPATITLANSIIHEDSPIDVLFSPMHRRVPFRLRHFSNASAVFGTTT